MAGRPRVVVDLAANAQHARELLVGGIFVPGCALPLSAECDLVVRGVGEQLELGARVVFRDGDRGAGVELIGFSAAMRAELVAMVARGHLPAPLAPPASSRDPHDAGSALPALDEVDLDDDLAIDGGFDPLAPSLTSAAVHEPTRELVEAAPAPDRNDPDALDYARPPGAARHVHERMRRLPLAQQIKKAHTGELHERVVLERMYGKTVWEPLLRNPRLTAPEVARIARMGQLPRPLIELIVGNGAWLQIPEVRRALLANPRLGTDQVVRVLRLLPKHELKLAAVQTAYPSSVRDHARKLLKEP